MIALKHKASQLNKLLIINILTSSRLTNAPNWITRCANLSKRALLLCSATSTHRNRADHKPEQIAERWRTHSRIRQKQASIRAMRVILEKGIKKESTMQKGCRKTKGHHC
jgi:hypothetical protein